MKFLKFWLPLLIWLGLIFCLSSLPAQALPVQLLDTLSSYFGHFFEYTILGLLILSNLLNIKYGTEESIVMVSKIYSILRNEAYKSSIQMAKERGKFLIYALSFGGFYAITDEFHQSFVPSRFFSIWDILVDILGISFALFLIFFWKKRQSS